MGSPQMSASAIVPGPALVTIQSATSMYSLILLTNPSTCTSTSHRRARNSANKRAFRPHIITICTSSRASANLPAMATAICPNLPTPSPPPTSRSVIFSGQRPNSLLRSAGSPKPAIDQKPCRTGRPYSRIRVSSIPTSLASARTGSDGMYRRCVLGCSHMGWAEPRSVTTVTNGGGGTSECSAARCSVRVVIVCTIGWTEMMRSGSKWAKAAATWSAAERSATMLKAEWKSGLAETW
mmetsp:Transcript_43912/g.107781  ORF Transcript_43912/g.107781 Transcript_43912/m.107781 type:complete len:238 (+) Transcript_43912:499-1212(+)